MIQRRRAVGRLSAAAFVALTLVAATGCASSTDDSDELRRSTDSTATTGTELAGVQVDVRRDPG